MIPGMASKELTPENVKKLKDYLAEQFGLTQDDNFDGIFPLLLALWGSGIPISVYQFFHNLLVLEKQIQQYLESLGADIATAESTLNSLSTLGPLTLGPQVIV